MDTNAQRGFTLIELLVTVSISAILLGIGVPSFSNAVKNSRVGVDYNELVQALYLARSEAVKTSSLVTVCARQTIDSQVCSTSSDDSHWNNGWLVFIDNNAPVGENFAKIDPDDELIAEHAEQRSENTIKNLGSPNRSFASAESASFVRYQANGSANWESGSFTLCDPQNKNSRAINISPTGDIRPARDSNGSGIVLDSFNRPAC